MSKLALLDGESTCNFEQSELWEPDREQELALCKQIIEERAFSSTGYPLALEFAERFREQVAGTEYVLNHNNGTAALLAAYFAIGVGPGDEIITPTYNWIAGFAPATLLGARPVFCDMDPETLCMDPADLPRRLSERTKVLLVPHLFGGVCDMEPIMAFARKHDLQVIEDCSHVHGARYGGKLIGSIGDIGCYSMQGGNPGGKAVGAGEGGVLATNNRHYYERALAMAHVHHYNLGEELTEPPFNQLPHQGLSLAKHRPSNLSLAIALVSLDSLEYRNRRMRENYARLTHLIEEGIPCLRILKTYAKAEPAGFYGNLRVVYQPEELGGLPADKFHEAAMAEGANLGGRQYVGWHMTPPYDTGMAYYDDGRGPLSPAEGYQPQPCGSLPHAESIIPNIMALPRMIEPPEGYAEAYVAALRKVVDNYQDLL